MLAVSAGARVPLSWDLPLALLIMVAVLVPHFAFFERARVLERKGFRCRQCGYDLQGQEASRCPECGAKLDPADQKRSQSEEASNRPKQAR